MHSILILEDEDYFKTNCIGTGAIIISTISWKYKVIRISVYFYFQNTNLFKTIIIGTGDNIISTETWTWKVSPIFVYLIIKIGTVIKRKIVSEPEQILPAPKRERKTWILFQSSFIFKISTLKTVLSEPEKVIIITET